MPRSLEDRVRAGVGTFTEWLHDRDADIARAKAELEARGRQFYSGATARAEELVSRVAAGPGQRQPAARATLKAPRPGPTRDTKSPSTKQSAHRDRETQFLENARRLAGDADKWVRSTVQEVAGSEPFKKMAGDAAQAAGNVTGLATGGVKLAEDVKDGLVFAGRILNPADSYTHPRGEAAWDDVFATAGAVVDYGKKAIRDPNIVRRDLNS